MSSLAPLERANVPKRAYITTAAYSTDIYNYTRSYNSITEVWSGTLTSFSTAGTNMGSFNTAGVILRETGRKLYPDANPGISTYMVAVYHPEFGSGYIDPNSPKFAVYNSDKPTYIGDGIDPNGSLVDQGQPVYTRGTVTAVGNITTTAGNLAATTGSVSAGTSVNVGTKLNLPTGAAGIVGNASMASGTSSGGFRRLTVNTTAVTANSYIFITNTSINNAGTVYSVENINAGVSFEIVSNSTADASNINWLIIN